MESMSDQPFYDEPISRNQQKALINSILHKYREKKATEELKKSIWDELQLEKHKGRITIPFKVKLIKDPSQFRKDYIEVMLDTRV